MEWDNKPPPHYALVPAKAAMGRRNLELKNSDETVEVTLGVKSSKPEVSFQVSSYFSDDDDDEDYVSHRRNAVQYDDDLDIGSFYPKSGPSQKHIQLGNDIGTASTHTHMSNTKPKARSLSAGRQLIDGNEVATLRDQSGLPLLTLQGTVGSGPPDCTRTPDCIRTPSFHAIITGKTLLPTTERGSSSHRGESKKGKEASKKYYEELSRQVAEKKQLEALETRRNAAEEQKHHQTMLNALWGVQGSTVQNYRLRTAKRTKSLYTSGIIPQEQMFSKGFNGIPFRRQ